MHSTQGILYIRYLQTYVLISIEFESSHLVKQLSCHHLFANKAVTDRFSFFFFFFLSNLRLDYLIVCSILSAHLILQ